MKKLIDIKEMAKKMAHNKEVRVYGNPSLSAYLVTTDDSRDAYEVFLVRDPETDAGFSANGQKEYYRLDGLGVTVEIMAQKVEPRAWDKIRKEIEFNADEFLTDCANAKRYTEVCPW